MFGYSQTTFKVSFWGAAHQTEEPAPFFRPVASGWQQDELLNSATWHFRTMPRAPLVEIIRRSHGHLSPVSAVFRVFFPNLTATFTLLVAQGIYSQNVHAYRVLKQLDGIPGKRIIQQPGIG